jgi:hypothetical protein
MRSISLASFAVLESTWSVDVTDSAKSCGGWALCGGGTWRGLGGDEDRDEGGNFWPLVEDEDGFMKQGLQYRMGCLAVPAFGLVAMGPG